MLKTLKNSLARGTKALCHRRVYFFMMLVFPLMSIWFFADLMTEGLPLPVPVEVVDLDQSSMSRQTIRTLNANQFVTISQDAQSYRDAMDKMNRGEIFGFFFIPRDFQQHAIAGDKPTLMFYTNMAYFVPGTMSFKGFKQTAVTATGGLVTMTLTSVGVDESTVGSMLQPVVVQSHPIGNPCLNYGIYLNNSFVPGMLALFIMLTTAFSVCDEIKRGTSVAWLRNSGNSMITALMGKLLPQTVIWSVVGIFTQVLFYKYLQYPCNAPLGYMIVAMLLLIVSSQAFAVICCEIMPNLRMSLILCALTGILSFSILGFSFPVEQMYGGIAIFSWIMPLRYYFLIYIDQALNGYPLYYSRLYYAAMCIFPVVALIGLPRLKKRCLKPIYVP